jgi:hypothetical protein
MRAERMVEAVAMLPLLLASRPIREAMEGSMPLHMLLQFPLLLAAGAAAGHLASNRALPVVSAWRFVDGQGLLGLITLLVVAAFWMLPVALDAALMHAEVAVCKYVSWWLAGWGVALGRPRMPEALHLFLLGNLAWMFFTAGALYAEELWSGIGLCAVGAVMMTLLLNRASAWAWTRDGGRNPPAAT